MPEKLNSGWNNSKMKIKSFKYAGTKKTGFKYYIILGGGNIVNYLCDIEPAINAKEVIVKNNFESIFNPLPFSKADELKKFKDLLDAGAITRSEYDSIKAKILK